MGPASEDRAGDIGKVRGSKGATVNFRTEDGHKDSISVKGLQRRGLRGRGSVRDQEKGWEQGTRGWGQDA